MADPTALNARLRKLPSVDELLGDAQVQALLARHPRPVVVRAARAAVDQARRRLLGGETEASVGAEQVARAVAEALRPGLARVINATGVILHTNLGRAPLAAPAAARMAEVAQGAVDLEYDLGLGARGARGAAAMELLAELCGAESALAVNNNAAAVLLALSVLARGREVIVSRGELVEIGGGFRIPEVLAQSGARLVEVGTTNKTRAADYAAAIGPETASLLKVHQSNFRMVGFTEEATLGELAELARPRGLPLLFDLGSGCMVEPLAAELPPEPTPARALRAGADLVCMSGDKLFGGPQAGLVVGSKALVERLARHPLMRALRVDKTTLAALEATLALYRDGREGEIPAIRMLRESVASVLVRAQRLAERLAAAGVAGEVVATSSQVGAGSIPGASLASAAVALSGDPEALAARLRQGDPPAVARIHEGRLLLDVRTVPDSEIEPLARAVSVAFNSGGSEVSC